MGIGEDVKHKMGLRHAMRVPQKNITTLYASFYFVYRGKSLKIPNVSDWPEPSNFYDKIPIAFLKKRFYDVYHTRTF